MQLEVGAIFEGKITGITRFGAFVALPAGGSGLVHISEISNTYVSDVHDCLAEGQTVKVKVIAFGDGGKVNLSMKRVEETPRPPQPARQPMRHRAQGAASRVPAGEPSFEDKLKAFMQDSDNRMSGNKLYAERRGGRRRRD